MKNLPLNFDMSKLCTEKSLAKFLNSTTFIDFYNRLRLIAKTMFEWKGFPDTVNTRFLEESLYHFGRVAFYDDEDFGLIVAKCTTANVVNIYNEPTEISTISNCPGYTPKTLKVGTDCVLIRNNVEMIPTDFTIQQFAYRLYNAQRSIDVNIGNQKFPAVVVCDEKQLMSFKKAFENIQENEPVVFADKQMNIDGIKALNMEIPFVADKLTQAKHEIWNECMTFLGLNNANTDKKERLITDEVNSNNELIEMMTEVMLAERKRACEEIKKLYNIDVTVELRNYDKVKKEVDKDKEEKAGEDNG